MIFPSLAHATGRRLLWFAIIFVPSVLLAQDKSLWQPATAQQAGLEAADGLSIEMLPGSTNAPDTFRVTDNFNRSSLGSNWAHQSQYWKILDGELHLTSAATRSWAYAAIFRPIASDSEKRIVSVGHRWGKTADAEGIKEGAMAIMADAASAWSSGYWLWHRTNWRQVWLWTYRNGFHQDGKDIDRVGARTWNPVAGDFVHAVIRPGEHANYFDYYVEGRFDGTVTDPEKCYPTTTEWYVGFFLRGEGVNNSVDDFVVTYVKDRPDTTPPERIADLSISNVTDGQFELDWTAPDDAEAGRASAYLLRHSLVPITKENFATAWPIEISEPATAGSAERLAITGLQPDTTYYFAFKAVDDAGNVSSLSNVVADRTLPLRSVSLIDASLPVQITGQAGEASDSLVTVALRDQYGRAALQAPVHLGASASPETSPELTGWHSPGVPTEFPWFQTPADGAIFPGAIRRHPVQAASTLFLQLPVSAEVSSHLYARSRSTNDNSASLSLSIQSQQISGQITVPADKASSGWQWLPLIAESGAPAEITAPAGMLELELEFASENLLFDQLLLLPVTARAPDSTLIFPGIGALTDSLGGLSWSPQMPQKAGKDTLFIFAAGTRSDTGIPVNTAAGPAAELEIYSGQFQTGTAGMALQDSLVVRVLDQFGNPVPNVVVSFSAPSAVQILPEAKRLSDANGLAAVACIPAEGTQQQTVSASLGNGTPESRFSLFLKASGAASIERLNTAEAATAALRAFPDSLKLRVLDAAGFWVAGAEVRWQVISGDVLIAGLQTGTTQTNIFGESSISVEAGRLAGKAQISASINSATDSLKEFWQLEVLPLAPFKIAAAQQAAVISIAPEQPQSLSVGVVDSLDNPVPGSRVTYEVKSGGLRFASGHIDSSFTNSSGVASVRVVPLNDYADRGEYLLSAGAGLTDSRTYRMAQPATIRLLRPDPLAGIIGMELADSLKLQILDELAEPAAGAVIRVDPRSGGVIAAHGREANSFEAKDDGTLALAWRLGGQSYPAADSLALFLQNNQGSKADTVLLAAAERDSTLILESLTPASLGIWQYPASIPLNLQVMDAARQAIADQAVQIRLIRGSAVQILDLVSDDGGLVRNEILITELDIPAHLLAYASFGAVRLSKAELRYQINAIAAAPATMQIISGQDQVAGAGLVLPQKIRLKIFDAASQGIPDVPVRITALDGEILGDDLETLVSGDSGIVEFDWRLGAQDGIQKLLLEPAVFPELSENVAVSLQARADAEFDNRPPAFIAAFVPVFTEGEMRQFTVEAADRDEDDLTFAVLSAPVGMQISLAAPVQITWRPEFDQAGEHKLVLRVRDIYHNADTLSLQIQVQNRNRAPQIVQRYPEQEAVLISGQDSLKFSIQARDADNDSLSYLWQLTTDTGPQLAGRLPLVTLTKALLRSGQLKVKIDDGQDSTFALWRLQTSVGVQNKGSQQINWASAAQPNPFGGLRFPSSRTRVHLARPGWLKAEILDLRGRVVLELFSGRVDAGLHVLEWRGENRSGNAAPSGIYFMRIRHGKWQQVIKLHLLR